MKSKLKSNLYILGDRGTGSVSEPVLVTIETIDNLTNLSEKIPENLISPFYRSIDINCGKIIKITDMTEKIEYFWANIKGTKMQKGQFFLAENNDNLITCYHYKVAAVESVEPSDKFNGVRYTHYTNGRIKTKKCYIAGNIVWSYDFRNDMYNTVSETSTFRNGKPELINTFNEYEMLQGQKILTSNGKIFKELSY